MSKVWWMRSLSGLLVLPVASSRLSALKMARPLRASSSYSWIFSRCSVSCLAISARFFCAAAMMASYSAFLAEAFVVTLSRSAASLAKVR